MEDRRWLKRLAFPKPEDSGGEEPEERTARVQAAKAVCGRCPVLGACAAYGASVTPDGKLAQNVSVTTVALNRGALTWMDATGSQFLFYALVGSGGSVVTPPMAIRAASGTTGFVLTSSNGGGNSPNKGGLNIFLPLITRE